MWLSPRDLDAPGFRLFCLPHAGSGAAGFYRWKRLLPPSIAVCPVLLPGREARLAEPLLTEVRHSVQELHRHAQFALHQPYAVFGHSMGALLAFEWVRRIAAEGPPKPEFLFVSGRNAPHTAAGHMGLHELPAERLVAALKERYGGEPETLLADPELRDVFLPILRSDLKLVESYACDGTAPVPCELQALAGAEDRSVSEAGLARWAETTTARFGSRRFPGDHFYHFGAGQTELLHFIAETLESRTSAAR